MKSTAARNIAKSGVKEITSGKAAKQSYLPPPAESGKKQVETARQTRAKQEIPLDDGQDFADF